MNFIFMEQELFRSGGRDQDQSDDILPDVEPIFPDEHSEVPPVVIDGVLDRIEKEDHEEKERQKRIDRLRYPRTIH